MHLRVYLPLTTFTLLSHTTSTVSSPSSPKDTSSSASTTTASDSTQTTTFEFSSSEDDSIFEHNLDALLQHSPLSDTFEDVEDAEDDFSSDSYSAFDCSEETEVEAETDGFEGSRLEGLGIESIEDVLKRLGIEGGLGDDEQETAGRS